MVRAHLAAIGAVDLAHLLLDEGVARLTEHRHAAVLAHDLERVPGEARVVDDARTTLLLEEGLREQSHEVVALDEGAVLIEEEAAVEVAVPGEAQVGAVLADGLDGGRAVGLEHRVRYAVREMAIGRVPDLDELERQVRLEQVHERSRPAVAGIDHDLETTQLAAIDVGEQVVDVRATRVERVAQTRAPTVRRHRRRQPPVLDHRRHVLEARVGADRPRPLAHELHAVVIGRVVARRDHDAAVELAARAVAGGGREIHALRAALADVVNVDPALGETARQRRRKRRAREAHVMADDHARRLHEAGIRPPHCEREVLVDLIGDATADVVGFESGEFHGLLLSRPYRSSKRTMSSSPR